MGDLKEKLQEKINLAGSLGADVELIGTWVWAKFNARPAKEVREKLIEAKFRWNKKRQTWQFAGTFSRGSDAQKPQLAAKYGYQNFTKKEDQQAVQS